MMVSYAANYFSEKLFLEMHGVCSRGATCFLMDEQAYIIAHPQLSHSPLETAQASGKRERMVNDTVRRAVGDANSAIVGYPRMRRPVIADNAGVFVGDLYGAVAQKLLTLQLLVQRTTKGNTPQKNGMVYEINMKLLAARGGEISGIVTRPELMEFVVREVPGTNVVLVVLLNKGEAQGAVQRAKEYCGTFSNQCPDVQAPWAAVTEMGDTDLEDLVNTCNSEVVRGAGAARTCPVRADYIATQLWQSNSSSGLRSQIRAARVASGQQVCRTQLEESLNTIIIAVVLASVGGAALFVTRMQAKKLKQKQLAETRAYTDLLHQPIKEISECATLLRDECHRVIGAARSFYDFEYLIDVLEREAVNLLVRQNRCQLRHQSIELQAIKDLLYQLKTDMHKIHIRTTRLESATAELEEAEHKLPEHEEYAKQLRKKIDQLIKRDAEETGTHSQKSSPSTQ
jgi:hypothetical protein